MSHKARVDRMFQQRSSWESLWDIVYSYVSPERHDAFQSKTDSPGSVQARIFDSTAMDAAERLNNLLLSGLVPPWQDWFRIMPGNEVRSQEDRSALQPLLQEAEDKMRAVLADGRFYQEMQPLLADRMTGGTACMEAAEDNGLYFRCVPLAEVAISEDAHGRVASVARKSSWTTEMLRDVYEDKLDETWLNTAKPDDRHDVMELQTLQIDNQYHWCRSLCSPYASPESNERVLEEHTTTLPRLMVTRWSKVPGTPYGRGPAIRALGDIRALNKIKELSLKNAALATSGVYTVVNDGVINAYTMTIEPGARIPVASNSPNERSIDVLPTSADFNVAMFSMEDLRNSILHSFMADQFTPAGRTPLSATEIAERTRIVANEAGATIARLQEEVVSFCLKHALRHLKENGELPEQLEADGTLTEIRYVSRLSQAQWAEEKANILSLAQVASAFGSFDPEAGLTIDTGKAIRRVAELDNIPTELMRSPERVQELIQQASEVQVAQAAMQQEAPDAVE